MRRFGTYAKITLLAFLAAGMTAALSACSDPKPETAEVSLSFPDMAPEASQSVRILEYGPDGRFLDEGTVQPGSTGVAVSGDAATLVAYTAAGGSRQEVFNKNVLATASLRLAPADEALLRSWNSVLSAFADAGTDMRVDPKSVTPCKAPDTGLQVASGSVAGKMGLVFHPACTVTLVMLTGARGLGSVAAADAWATGLAAGLRLVDGERNDGLAAAPVRVYRDGASVIAEMRSFGVAEGSARTLLLTLTDAYGDVHVYAYALPEEDVKTGPASGYVIIPSGIVIPDAPAEGGLAPGLEDWASAYVDIKL